MKANSNVILNKEKPKRFIECLLPVTACNLKCSYCYVIQEKRRTNQMPKFKYSPEHIGKALSKERLGGVSYISICGAGETLLPYESVEIIREILKQGHYVNVTTNGTITQRFEQICSFPKEFLERLHFSFSFHYLELLKKNYIDTFFNNIKNVREAGASYIVQINLADEYIPHLEEIKQICLENIGAYPQVAATRDEKSNKFKLLTKYTREEYENYGKSFNSPLFDFTMKNFMVKRKEFCYAGDWSFILDLSTGVARRCYNDRYSQNIFENINKPIEFKAIGNDCRSQFCVNSSHFMSLGIIPSIETLTYQKLRNREEADWTSEKMNTFLNSKLYESNKIYTSFKKLNANLNSKKDLPIRVLKKIKREFSKILKEKSK